MIKQRSERRTPNAAISRMLHLRRHSVDVDGHYAVVGAPSAGDDYEGRAFIFSRVSGIWLVEQQFSAASPYKDGFFGFSAAISGTTAVISGLDGTGEEAGGYAYVYTRNMSSNSWTPLQRVNGTGSSRFGASIAFDGDTLAIGSEDPASGGTTFSGAVYMYQRRNRLWVEQARLAAPADACNKFGRALALSDDILVVAPSRYYSAGEHLCAAAYEYRRQRDGHWSPTPTKLTSANLIDNVFVEKGSKARPAIAYDTLITVDANSNLASVYVSTKRSPWTLQATLNATVPGATVPPVMLGFSYTTGAAGGAMRNGFLVIAAETTAHSAIQSSGLAYSWQRVGGTWGPATEYTSPNPKKWGKFGAQL
jgi:hypothetical protein